jgi:hypothetical protein
MLAAAASSRRAFFLDFFDPWGNRIENRRLRQHPVHETRIYGAAWGRHICQRPSKTSRSVPASNVGGRSQVIKEKLMIDTLLHKTCTPCKGGIPPTPSPSR